jgi:DNA-binding SARP family transcriptional activator/TolB-like protein
MQLKLFGGFALLNRRADKMQVPLKRGRALLAYLALKQTRTESREVIVDLLWPDRFKEQAQASLRQVLFELRKISSGHAPIISSTRGEVAIGPAVKECDVWDFEACTVSNDLADAEQLLVLYRGPFLDGPFIGSEPFQQWAAIQRARLEGQLESAVLNATAGDRERGADDRFGRALERLIRSSPMCCQAVLRLMEIEAGKGRAADAIRHYERYARRLKIEFDEVPPVELSDACAMLKSAPNQPARFSTPRRRPAFAGKDPWRRAGIDAPVVAVLPFRYDGNEGSGGALAAALGEDITLILSSCRWFNVLSRSATHSWRANTPFVPNDFARRTGADYLIYGAVTERFGVWSVTIELADAETGYISWAKRYDSTNADIMSWGGEVCPLIVAALDPAVAESERKSFGKPALAATGSEVAYQHLIVGYRHFYAGAWTDALAAFGRAIGEDTTYAHAHAMLAVTTYLFAQVHRDDRWDAALQEAERSAGRALEIDPSEAKACNILGQVLDWQGRHDESLAHLERAVVLNPSFAQASTGLCYHSVMIGAFDDAKAYIQTAMRLRVGDAGLGLCLPAKALADLHLGNHRDALQTAHWAMRLQPKFWLCRQILSTCLWASGNTDAARKIVAALQRDYGGLSGKEFADWFPYASPDIGEPVRHALRQSGWH